MSELSGSEFGRGSEMGGAGDKQEGKTGQGQVIGKEYHLSPMQYLSRRGIRAIQGYGEGEGPENEQKKQ